MKSIKGLVAIVAGAVIAAVVTTTYIMKHPNLDSAVSIKSSWLSQEDKDSAVDRLVRLSCDKTFRQAFKPGVQIVPSGLVDEINEQQEAYQYLSDNIIVYGNDSYKGRYICTYYKDGRDPVLVVNMDGGVKPLLKK